MIITRAQRVALAKVWARGGNGNIKSYREFRKLVWPMLGGGGAIIVPWAGMWLGIEPDGYTHS